VIYGVERVNEHAMDDRWILSNLGDYRKSHL